MAKTVETKWEVWTYDVWGNSEEGYEVNDRFCKHREYPLALEVEVYNVGTPQEFEGASPTDEQIKEILSITGWTEIDVDGDDLSLYVSSADDGCPLGELRCVSHRSLSPVEYELLV